MVKLRYLPGAVYLTRGCYTTVETRRSLNMETEMGDMLIGTLCVRSQIGIYFKLADLHVAAHSVSGTSPATINASGEQITHSAPDVLRG